MQANTQRIVVIGSGISGMKAAYDLATSLPNSQLTVLQAQNYLGGRTHAVPHTLSDNSSFLFDVGASWVHQSSSKHPITKLVKQTEIKYVETDEERMLTYDSKGEEIPKWKFNSSFKDYKKVMKKLEDTDKDMTVFEGMKKKCADKMTDPLFMFQVGYDVEFETSASIRDLSGWEAYNDDEFDGREMLVTNDYGRICAYLAKNAPITVLLEHKVVAVVRKGNISEITCQNGKKFEAERVIIAVPLGALKAGTIKFTPALPQPKAEAIARMGVGNVCKVLIQFPSPPTTQKQHYFSVIPDNVDQRGLLAFYLNLFAFTGKPLMMTFGLGESADVVEKMGEQELHQIIAERVSAFADNQVKPQEIKTKRTAWRGNPNFGGSYSYPRMGCSYKEYQALARPVFENQWYFCGEHTTCRYRSTVHGAYLSGLEVAKIIIKNVTQNNYEYFDYKWHLENDSD